MTLGICPGWLSRNYKALGYTCAYRALPTRGGGPDSWVFFFTGLDHLQLADQSLGITSTSGSRTVQFQCRCSFYGRTSLGALLSMMMNVVLKASGWLRVGLDLD